MLKHVKARTSEARQAETRSRRVFQVARKVAAAIGTEFFQAISKHLTTLLAADCVLIGEFAAGHTEYVRTLGAHMDGRPVTFEYHVEDTASAPLVYGKTTQCRAEAQSRYPSDPLIGVARAQALLGLPLLDPQGRAIGLIVVLYRHPVASFSVAKDMIQFFCQRAAAELNHKREEDELRERDERYRAFVARNADAMWRLEFEQPIDTARSVEDQIAGMYRYGYVAECNDALAHMLGLTKAEQVIGSRLEAIAPESDVQIRNAVLKSIRNRYGCTTIEITRTDANGTERHLLRSQWGIVEDGKLQRIWGTTRDITELKQSEAEVDAGRRRMSDLLDTMKLAVIMEDPQGVITHCNRHFYKTTGWHPNAIVGKSWFELMAPSDEGKLHSIIERARARPESPVHFEGTLLGPEAQRWEFDWDRTSLRDREGHVVAWANIGREVTAHKALEAQLRQAQKLATIGKVAGGLAHDFNHLLTVILGYSARLLDDGYSLDPSSYTALDEIRKAATRGAELTTRLLAFGRRQVLQPELLNLNALILDSEQMLHNLAGGKVGLRLDLDPSAGAVRVDASSFRQVLINLTVNARDAMPEGGDLVISTKNETTVESESSTIVAGDYVRLSFSDVGKGMTPEVRDHIFEPFFTTKEQGKGTGLGLSTVYGIVQQSGGSIFVDTEPGKGSTFRIYLPRQKSGVPRPLPRPKPVPEVMPGGSENILLVEDREDVRELMARTLGDLGYAVSEAADSASALKILRDRSAIDLLITDVAMPGINGFELADLIRTYKSGIKVLFMSGYADPERFAEKLSDPGCAYLPKPFTPHSLATAIRRLLDCA
jgi:PAS domain S-box-containing protein